jgi:hypothetical protein
MSNGDALPTVLVDGYVCGVWRPAPERADAIEVTAFHSLDEDLGRAGSRGAFAGGLLAGRQPEVYRRYARWWTTLPSAEVRFLRG